MVIQYNEILSVITQLGDDEDIRITVKQSAKGGIIAGLICAIGGLVAGPIGFVFGGTAGGLVASYFAGDSFKSISTVINEMNPAHQRELTESVLKIIEHTDAMDAIQVLAIIQGNAVLRGQVKAQMISFCQQSLNSIS